MSTRILREKNAIFALRNPQHIPVECRRTLLEGISGAYKLSLDKSPIVRVRSFLASIYEFENGAQLKLKLFFHDDFERTTLCEMAGN